MVVSVELNERDAQAVASYAKREGMSLPEMVSQIVREYMDQNDGRAETMRAVNDVNHHRNLSRSFSSVEELMEELNA